MQMVDSITIRAKSWIYDKLFSNYSGIFGTQSNFGFKDLNHIIKDVQGVEVRVLI